MSSAEYTLEHTNTSSVKHCELSPEEKRAWLYYRNKAYALWRSNVEQTKKYNEYLDDANRTIADLEILVEEQEQEMNALIRQINRIKLKRD